jgi:hypothetical protein
MDEELISVRDIAAQHGKRKQTVFKILKRLGIETTKRRSASGKNQRVAYITQEQLGIVRAELLTIPSEEESDDGELNGIETTTDQGVFYLFQLEPEFDPGRFKVGFATSVSERLRHARCFALFAKVIRSWPCQPLWERTAIDSVSAGCERLHTEVFRAVSLEDIIARCERFFAVMPSLTAPPSEPSGTEPVEVSLQET